MEFWYPIALVGLVVYRIVTGTLTSIVANSKELPGWWFTAGFFCGVTGLLAACGMRPVKA